MSWETTVIKRRKPSWRRFVLGWLIIGIYMVIEPFLTPYYLWRMAEDIRNANRLPVQARRSALRYQRSGAR
jgi:hypothetical protein